MQLEYNISCNYLKIFSNYLKTLFYGGVFTCEYLGICNNELISIFCLYFYMMYFENMYTCTFWYSRGIKIKGEHSLSLISNNNWTKTIILRHIFIYVNFKYNNWVCNKMHYLTEFQHALPFVAQNMSKWYSSSHHVFSNLN